MAARTTTTARPRATTSRTTAKKVKVDFDLDAALAEELDDDDTEAPTKVVQILGQTFTIKCRVNEFLLNGALGGDPQALHRFFEALMSREDYLRFKEAMSTAPNMNAERFIKTFTKLLEVVAERPYELTLRLTSWVTLDGRLEELRGLVTMQGGPNIMDLSFTAFLDVVWAHIVTPPAMADAFEWRETMFCWFYLGHEPEKIQVYDPKTKRHSTKLKPRDPQRTTGAGIVKVEPSKVALRADAEMTRLREKAMANREKRTGSRSAKRVVPQVTHDAEPAEG